MTVYTMFLMLLFVWAVVQCLPFDDGKYNPKKYKIYDDGKYYRSLSEGKYVPGDEGKYTYVYKQGLYPEDDGDYRYIHQVGPEGGFGGSGGFGGIGGAGSKGGDRLNDPRGSDEAYKPNKIEYIGRKIYANRYPYIQKIIKGLIDAYVSKDILAPEGSTTHHYSKAYADNAYAVKCQYLTPDLKLNYTEFPIQVFPPRPDIKEGEKSGSYYSFKGKKLLDRANNALTKNMKLEFEIFVRVVNDVTD